MEGGLDGDKLMTLEEVGEMMRRSVWTVRKLIRGGVLIPVVKFGDRGTTIRKSVVERVIRMSEGEGYGPKNRIARIPKRRRVT